MGCVHLASELLEDTLRGWGLSSAQDAGGGTRFLEAPSPLVLMMVVVPSWRWRQWRETSIALRAVLTRLIPPGALPMLCSTVTSSVQVTRTLIDGGAALNILSVKTFNNLQVPYDQLQPTKPFSGVTDGSTTPIGQVRLPVTFG